MVQITEPPHRYSIGAAVFEAPPLGPGLYVTATPIGNLGDITLRALETLSAADLILCEDTRVTAKLLNRYGIRNSLSPYHDHNAAKVRPAVLARMADGQALALVSDAGSPLLSDPGYKLVQAAVEAGIAVTAIPGASAVLDALTLSALPPDRFMFCGFLPARSGARRHFLEDLKGVHATLVMFDTAGRLAESLEDIAAILGDRDVAVGRELTKLHEQVIRGPAREVRDELLARQSLKGEITLVIAPPVADAIPAPQAMVDSALRKALETMPASRAAAEIAKRFGLSKQETYARLLELKEGG
ncbi:MAG: 16S rRNA (cytidine(1402)-2'-O)-methyltransferase [Rhizobiales bacterium]|nr:16S rRNA (cytidine(1402)-2'-O)-methyltransferase [Hyphomicrobiales bacterium]